jgi:tripartite-type tricarboxylate transporter receptor subunit TctC
VTFRNVILAAARASILTLALTPAASAQSLADFYRSHTPIILVGSDVGGGYDLYSRLLARYWSRHFPGNPNIIVENMPGANGVTMMNALVNTQPRDGTIIGAAFAADLTEPVVDQGKLTKYDSREVSWIGNIAPQYNTCFVGKNSKIKTLDDAMKNETLISATGANSNSAVIANVYNTLIGTKFKVILGYTSTSLILAIERGEVDGTCLSYDTLVAAQPDMVARHLFNWLIVLNDEPVAELPDTPPATKFARTEEERQMLELLIARNLLGRPYAVAKEVPADRLAALRQSFMETMKDPDYLAETRKLSMTVEPADHVAMEKMIANVYTIPQKIVQRVIALTKTY